MPPASRKYTPILSALLILVIGLIVFAIWKRPKDSPVPLPDRHTAALGVRPSAEEWSALKIYDGVLTEQQFGKLLRDLYTWDGDAEEFFEITPQSVTVATSEDSRVTIALTSTEPAKPPERFWRPVTALPPAAAGKPLDGLRIAIDPGHLGGDFAQMEERWYRISKETKAVAEGDMTLATAKILKPQLEALGAAVTLVRTEGKPVTNNTPEDFQSYANETHRGAPKDEIRRKAEQLFYRTAEIRARAKKVNEEIKPDIILCLHFNADAWGDNPNAPYFSERNHFHIITHGAYMPGEIAHEDERLEMLYKLFQGTHEEETAIATELVKSFKRETGLSEYIYKVDAPTIKVGDCLWARNLLANRLYRCPVLFLEPYVMNNAVFHERVQAGDYEGEREIAGILRKSLFREYAEAVTQGLVNYYEPRRK